MTAEAEAASEPLDPELTRALRAVLDPEIGINVVDLGLVYQARREGNLARVVMTMTTPACPMHETLTADVREALLSLGGGIEDVDLQLVFEPRWSPERMSDEARSLLGI